MIVSFVSKQISKQFSVSFIHLSLKVNEIKVDKNINWEIHQCNEEKILK